MQDTRVRSMGQEDLLGKEMTTHSSILVWEFPWTEEPGGLPFMRSQESDHDLVTKPSPLMLQVYSWRKCSYFQEVLQQFAISSDVFHLEAMVYFCVF